MTKKIYPLFLPPVDLSQKPAKEWTRQEAEAYYTWMLGCLDRRVADFLQYLNESPDQTCEPLLRRVGNKLESIMHNRNFYVETAEGKRLSNAGYAIAADAGLLVAKCLVANGNGKVFWKVLQKPKGAQSYNLPVLTGFESGIDFDPIAASIAQATGVLRGAVKKERWLMLYERNR